MSVIGAGVGPACREALRGLGIGQGLPAGREGRAVAAAAGSPCREWWSEKGCWDWVESAGGEGRLLSRTNVMLAAALPVAVEGNCTA